MFRRHKNIAILALIAVAPVLAQTANKVSFPRDIAPVLKQKCMECHGQAPLAANLDLRTRDTALRGGDHGPAFVPGAAAGSHLYRRLTGQEQPQMPMGGRLTDGEISAIKDWIDAGAEWDAGLALAPATVTSAPAEKKFTDQQRRYWAFQKVVKPAVPAVQARNPIDAFLLAKLGEKQIEPNPPADKITLLRRASVRRSARGAGRKPFCSILARMKASIGFRTQPASATAGTGGRTGLRNDHHDAALAGEDVSQRAPELIQSRSTPISDAVSGAFPGGICNSPSRRTAL